MKKYIFAFLLGVLAILSVNSKETIYDVGLFDKVSVLGDLNIVYCSNPDSTGMAVYRSEKDFSDVLEVTNDKGKLSLREKVGHTMGNVPTIHIYSDYLTQIRYEGNSVLTANLATATPVFSVNLTGNGNVICNDVNANEVSASLTTGNGKIILYGKCSEAKFSLTGTGSIQADKLKAASVKCTALGTGSIGCHPLTMLDVRGLGSTKIYFSGAPIIKKVGTATLVRLEATGDTPELYTTEPAEVPDHAIEYDDEDVDDDSEASLDEDDDEDDDDSNDDDEVTEVTESPSNYAD